jgi:hypothetical protein
VEHCADDDLSLIALGESATATDEAHLRSCSRCQSRLDQLAAVVATARSVDDADHPVAPPAGVWTGITAELGLEEAAPVISIETARGARRRRTWLVAAAAAVVGVAIGGLATAGIVTSTGSEQVVAQAPLSPIDDSGFTGTAMVQRGADGTVLVVDVPGLPPVDDGYYEVWMATPDTSTMVAIGILDTGQVGRFALPADMDTASFPVVDVSVEHFDGDNGHSATSVSRGQLPA